MAAATQYLAVPLFAFACIILMHKSSPVGTGKRTLSDCTLSWEYLTSYTINLTALICM